MTTFPPRREAPARRFGPVLLALANGHPRLRVDVDVPACCIRLTGECDMATAHLISDALAVLGAPPLGDVTVDLRRLRFVDATGLGAFVAARNQMLSGGRELRIVNVAVHAARVFAAAGLTPLVTTRWGLGGPRPDDD